MWRDESQPRRFTEDGYIFITIELWKCALVLPNVNLKKGTPEYELVKGALLLVVASILLGVIGYNFWF
ncbi:hypothetical protein [Acetobacterium bakii]|uniref:Uncharacterized protein n=1 Tax=Acetobacterium bakii TaxID=52689 RepID=A0A0L6U4M2_9FIRM|nr:hypothetical protein [Acetobacterium bakii]KNZ43448.1 hypothetical protein AKG39_00640 [Acetobacterium bakii]